MQNELKKLHALILDGDLMDAARLCDEVMAMAAPAAVAAQDALREAEAALEVAMARILKADPGHSISATSEAKALVAVRAALAATPAAAPAGWKLVPIEPTSEMLESAGAADRDGTPATYKTLYMAMVGASPAAAPVVLPEPGAAVKEVMGLIADLEREAADVGYGHGSQRLVNEKRAAIESKLRALLAGVSAPAAPTEQQILDAAEKAGLWPNTVQSWIPAFKRYHAALAAAPQAQADARDAESDYQRGYRHGYNRRDAEVQGALL